MKSLINLKRSFELVRLNRKPWSVSRSMRIAKLSFLIHYSNNR